MLAVAYVDPGTIATGAFDGEVCAYSAFVIDCVVNALQIILWNNNSGAIISRFKAPPRDTSVQSSCM